jgi:hypothetical protein
LKEEQNQYTGANIVFKTNSGGTTGHPQMKKMDLDTDLTFFKSNYLIWGRIVHTSNPSSWRLRQVDHEFEACLGYILNSRPERAT